MTRPSRREVENRLETLETIHRAEEKRQGPSRMVYRDPITGRCFKGMDRDAEPVTDLSEDTASRALDDLRDRDLVIERPDTTDGRRSRYVPKVLLTF